MRKTKEGQNYLPFRDEAVEGGEIKLLNRILSRHLQIATELGRQCTMQQGLTFEKKAITKCSTLKIDFSANFHLTHDFLLAEALSTPQKLENAKRNLQISI